MPALRNRFNNSPWRWLILVFLIALVVIGFSAHSTPPPKPPVTSYGALDQRISEHKVGHLIYNPNTFTVEVFEKSKKIAPYTIGVPAVNGGQLGLQQLLSVAQKANTPVQSLPISSGVSNSLLSILGRYLPTLLIIAALIYLMKAYIPGGKSKIEPAKSTVTFAEVAGCSEAIEELQDVRDFLANPKKYAALGATCPKGFLLHGEPGTGKTLLAKAVANEAGIPFYPISGADFIEMFAGLGARRVRQLFVAAKKTAPSIIFIDEIDAIGGVRSGGGGDGAVREGDQTLTQLLTEVDGFEVSEHPVILLAATNRFENLDPALLRPGRFDRHIAVDPPDRRGRLEILSVHAANKPLSENVSLEDMAMHSSGMSGADLAQWLNESALMAARNNHTKIEKEDCDDAYFRIIAGVKKHHRAMSERQRRLVAYHEAGHAIIGERLQSTERVHKISIIPRGRSGGQTISVSEEDVFLHTKEQLRNMLAMLLGGRAAEELTFKQLTTGAADDLQRATKLAFRMFTQNGMGDALGLRVASSTDKELVIGPEQQAAVDNEVKDLLESEYARARNILEEESASLELLAETLLVEETLDRERFLALLSEAGGLHQSASTPASAA